MSLAYQRASRHYKRSVFDDFTFCIFFTCFVFELLLLILGLHYYIDEHVDEHVNEQVNEHVDEPVTQLRDKCYVAFLGSVGRQLLCESMSTLSKQRRCSRQKNTSAMINEAR